MHPKKLPLASSIENSQLKQDKTITCSTFSERSARRTDISSRFGFVQYVGVTRWVFTDENNAEVRSLVSSRYPLLNLVTGFLPDLPGQLPSRNHNRIISVTEKALPKQSASLRPSKPSSVQHRPGKNGWQPQARAQKALLLAHEPIAPLWQIMLSSVFQS